MSETKTLPQIAPRMNDQRIMGISDGRKEVVFMRDTYNLMPVLHKTAIVLTQQALEEANSPSKDAQMDFLTRIAVASRHIFTGGLTKHEENCHAWMAIMQDAQQDDLKLAVYLLFSSLFTRAYMAMPLLLPNLGKCLTDDASDVNVIQESLITLLEGLDDTDRRKLISSLEMCGGIKSGMDMSIIRKTLPASIKDLLMGQAEGIQQRVAERLKEIENAKQNN